MATRLRDTNARRARNPRPDATGLRDHPHPRGAGFRGRSVRAASAIASPNCWPPARLARSASTRRAAGFPARDAPTSARRSGASRRFRDDLQDRRVEITGPTDRKMVINALNSGAKVFMADFEDSHSPTWDNVIAGPDQPARRGAPRRSSSPVPRASGTA